MAKLRAEAGTRTLRSPGQGVQESAMASRNMEKDQIGSRTVELLSPTFVDNLARRLASLHLFIKQHSDIRTFCNTVNCCWQNSCRSTTATAETTSTTTPMGYEQQAHRRETLGNLAPRSSQGHGNQSGVCSARFLVPTG